MANPACFHGRECRQHKREEGFFYASFPVIRHQLFALKPIIQGRKITDYKHEVVFIKATNQSWEDPDPKPRGAGASTALDSSSCLAWPGTAGKGQHWPSCRNPKSAKPDYQRKTRSSVEFIPMPWTFLSFNFYLSSTYLVCLMNSLICNLIMKTLQSISCLAGAEFVSLFDQDTHL